VDPDAALERIRKIVARADAPATDPVADHNELVDLIDGLDRWMSKGGFLPTDWRKYRDSNK
jgi:hypothetical protein